jgi:hypothetical protein
MRQICTPVMWKIHAPPPRIHIFMWLLANNKILTRDNLAKRRKVEDGTCLFCNETEKAVHLFFECCVACCLWEIVAEIMNMPVIRDFESQAKLWIRGGKYNAANVFHAAVLWSIWKRKKK